VKESESWKVHKNYYKYFGDTIVHIVTDHKQAEVIIKDKLGGIIVKVPPLATEAVADIGLYHRPKKVHNVTYGGTNICYGNPSGQNGMV